MDLKSILKAEVKAERGRIVVATKEGNPYAIVRLVSVDTAGTTREATLYCGWTKSEYDVREGSFFDFHLRGMKVRVFVLEVFTDRAVLSIAADENSGITARTLGPMDSMRKGT